MLLDDFLSILVGQYLRYDISFLSKNDADSRGPTYPLAMICCSAIELLGALASPNQFDPYKGRDYFINYWNIFLYPNQGNSGEALMFYKLVRNGLSHMAIPKGNIIFHRHNHGQHLSVDQSGAWNIDVTRLGEDLLTSYDDNFLPHLSVETNKLQAQTNLNNILSSYDSLAAQSNLSFPLNFSQQHGATGPVGAAGTLPVAINAAPSTP